MKKIVPKITVVIACVILIAVSFTSPVYATPFSEPLDKDQIWINQCVEQAQQYAEHQLEIVTLRENLVAYACSFAGKLPYVYGGNSLETGTDCSGFCHLIYEAYGFDVPRTASAFQAMGNITEDELKPGDIVAYNGGEHCGIYIGDGQIVHAANPYSDTLIADLYCETPTAFVSIIE